MKKTAVITGATSGVGRALAIRLALQGYKLVLPCRSLDKAEALRTSLLLQAPKVELDFIHCDLADLDSVARCASALVKRHPVIDVVVANAATVSPYRVLSAQGVELTFAVNHLSHFVLLQWLLGNLYTHSRVIVVGSSGARWGNPRFIEDPTYRRQSYGMFKAYANSKMANIVCAQQLSGNLSNRQIACVSVHPGMLDTTIWPQHTILRKMLYKPFRKFCLRAPQQGADVLEYFAMAPEHNESQGYFRQYQQAPAPRKINDRFGDQLWDVSMSLCRDFLPQSVNGVSGING